MKEAVITTNQKAEYYTDERCYILEMSNYTNDQNVSIARARVEQGKTTALHKLNGVDERYVILEGNGRVEVGNLHPTDVSKGDVVLIPRGTPQRITNTDDCDLIFLCICTPCFKLDCYEDLESCTQN